MQGRRDQSGAMGEDDPVRSVAARTMREAVARFGAPGDADAIFAACDILSREPYERQEAHGSLLLSARDHPSIDVLVQLLDPVPLRSRRAARKALQLCRAPVVPLCDGASIWAAGRLARPYDPARKDLFEVRFTGRGRWELHHAGAMLFAVAAGEAAMQRPVLDRDHFAAAVRSAFPTVDAAGVGRLWDAVAAVLEAGAGSTVVVVEGAAAETRRLSAQGTPIAPRLLDPEVLRAATGIGGALLLDPTGTCHAMGVILDGVAAGRGQSSRGSRFNTAAAYVAGRSGALAVVISDDGSVDLLTA